MENIVFTCTTCPLKRKTQITKDGSPSSLAIYGNRIVWDNSSDFNIFLYDLSTHKETRITNTEGISPAIYGDRIVYEASRNANSYNIYMYDLSTSKEIQITTSGLAESPDINGDRIVYQAARNGNNDIYMYNLSTKKEIQITTGGLEYGPKIYGDRIVWVDTSNGWDKLNLYMYDLSTSKETQIVTNVSDGALLYGIYGDKIVYEAIRNANSYNIYMYNISTSKITPVTTSGFAMNPDIYGDRIAYEVYRNGNSDIYMATIVSNPPVAMFSAFPTIGEEPLTVKFTDKSTGSPTNWSWNFGDGNTSTEQNPMHIYSVPGIYTVNLTAGNVNGTASKTATITVYEYSSSSGNSIGSSGGSSHSSSGGGSPEP